MKRTTLCAVAMLVCGQSGSAHEIEGSWTGRLLTGNMCADIPGSRGGSGELTVSLRLNQAGNRLEASGSLSLDAENRRRGFIRRLRGPFVARFRQSRTMERSSFITGVMSDSGREHKMMLKIVPEAGSGFHLKATVYDSMDCGPTGMTPSLRDGHGDINSSYIFELRKR